MKFAHKITAAACAGALAMTGVVPAFAEPVNKDGGEADVKISAAVGKDGDKIISVTMPSQMAVAVTTYADGNTDSATPGTFKSAEITEAEITNNAVSTSAVAIEVAKVSQVAGLDNGAKLLDIVNLGLLGENDPSSADASGRARVQLKDVLDGNTQLFTSIAKGGTARVSLDAQAKDATTVIPTDSYTVNATLKVTALDN